MKTRIYLVENGTDTFLVDASNKVVAINHIARKDIEAHVASQLELVQLLKDGTEIQKAGE